MFYYCQTCLDCLQRLDNLVDIDDQELFLLHHKTAASLEVAANAGCRFCSVFWDQYNESERKTIIDYDEADPIPEQRLPDPSDKSDHAWLVRKQMMQRYATRCVIQPARGVFRRTPERFENGVSYNMLLNSDRTLPPSGQRQDISIFLLELVDDDDTVQTPRTSPPRNTGAPDTWARAEMWINKCKIHHHACNASRSSTWLPTRLLDLSKVHLDGTIRVVETSDRRNVRQYVTLSHRWGSATPLLLTRETAHQLMAGVQLNALPQAFQDAVTICRRLDVSYLWIDSLCIRQDKDDLSDWMKEAALMHNVYSHSFLNISALAALDSDHSFFVDRNADMIPEAFIESALDGFEIGTKMRKYRIMNMLLWQSQLSHAHLNLRGWVLQERLLAPRVLHFGAQQLVWECHEMDATETYPDGLPTAMSVIAATRFKTLDAEFQAGRLQHVHKDDPPEMAPYRLWQRIVEAYTKCNLTKAEDKLIAIAGIAKHMSTILQDEYVVGMWRRYLASELLWSVTDQKQIDHRGAQRPSQSRAPSFSWASVDGIVRPGSPSEQELLIEVIDVEIQYATKDRTGLVSGGSILLRCQLQKIEVIRNPAYTKNYILKVNGIEARAEEGKEWDRIGPLIRLDEHESFFDPALADQNTLYCVPAHIWGDKEWLSVLLLQLDDSEQGTYRRFGLAQSNQAHDIEVIRRRPIGQVPLPAVSGKDGMQVIRLI